MIMQWRATGIREFRSEAAKVGLFYSSPERCFWVIFTSRTAYNRFMKRSRSLTQSVIPPCPWFRVIQAGRQVSRRSIRSIRKVRSFRGIQSLSRLRFHRIMVRHRFPSKRAIPLLVSPLSKELHYRPPEAKL